MIDDEVTVLIAGVLNDRRTPTDSRGRARAVRDILAAARMLGPNAYPTAEQISLADESGCRRDKDCILNDGHDGGCMDRDEDEEWRTH